MAQVMEVTHVCSLSSIMTRSTKPVPGSMQKPTGTIGHGAEQHLMHLPIGVIAKKTVQLKVIICGFTFIKHY